MMRKHLGVWLLLQWTTVFFLIIVSSEPYYLLVHQLVYRLIHKTSRFCDWEKQPRKRILTDNSKKIKRQRGRVLILKKKMNLMNRGRKRSSTPSIFISLLTLYAQPAVLGLRLFFIMRAYFISCIIKKNDNKISDGEIMQQLPNIYESRKIMWY